MSKPSTTEIREWTRTIVHQALELPVKRYVGNAVSWRHELGASSLQVLTILADLEELFELFDIEFSTEEMDTIDTIDQAVACIESKLAAS
jgi:acyl carrier protein